MAFRSLRHILTAMFVLLALATGAAAAVQVRVNPAVSSGLVGATITVTVEADSVADLGGFQFGFAYSKTELQAVSATINPAFDNVVIQDLGTATGNGMVAATVFAGPPQSGTPLVLASLQFKILAPAAGTINLSHLILGQVGGKEIASIPVNGAVITNPGVPTSVSATAGNAQATVSFSPPTRDGGSAITGYTVTSTPDGHTATGGTSPITVTGLTNGTAYTFTVTATNGVGIGAASDPCSAVTPSKASQTIIFGAAPTVVVGGTGTVSAIGGASGNSVTFSTTSTGCSVSGNVVTGLVAGTDNCVIRADQAGNGDYDPAPPVTQTLSIGQPPVITSGADTTFTYGEAGSFIVTTTGYPVPSLTRSGVLPLGVSFTDNGNGTAKISGTANVTGPFVFTIIAGSSSGSVSQSFTLTVEATAVVDLSAVDANIVVTPDRHLFGVEFLGDCGTPTTFTVRNIGTTGLTLGTLGLGGINGDQFAFGTDNCSATPLATGASCTAEVKFCPTSIGSKVALLQIPSDAPKTPVLTAFLHNHESTRQEAARRMPPVLKLLGIPDEMKANTSYTITWSLLGYDEEYLSGIAFFDCSGAPEGSCGESFASNFAYSGNLAPVASVTGDWTYNGVTSSRFDYSYTFTAPSATDIVIRFYRKSHGDNAAGKGSLSLLIPGNVLPPGTGTSYYGLDGRRLLHTILP